MASNDNLYGSECKSNPIYSELGDDQEGELLLRGTSIMKGYLNNPKANAETFTADGWMRTGDICKYDSKTQSFFITDRIKELIKYKGFQVAPAGNYINHQHEIHESHPSSAV